MKRHVTSVISAAVALITTSTWLVMRGRETPKGSGAIQIVSVPVRATRITRGLGGKAPGEKDAHTPSPEDVVASDDTTRLYAQIRAEKRDEQWATQSEAAINRYLLDVDALGTNSSFVVKCARTICEVNGTAAPGAPLNEVDRAWNTLRAAMKDCSSPDIALSNPSFTLGNGHSLHAFVIYFKRTATQ